MEHIPAILHRIAALPGAQVDFGFGQDREAVRHQYELLDGEAVSDLFLDARFDDHQEIMNDFYAWILPYHLPDEYRAFVGQFGGFLIQTADHTLMVKGFGPLCYEFYEPLVPEEAVTDPRQDGILDIGWLEYADGLGGFTHIVLCLDLAGAFQRASVFGIRTQSVDAPSIRQMSIDPTNYGSEWKILAKSCTEWLELIEQTHGHLGYLDTQNRDPDDL
jgi:hypothetical protein